MDYGVGRHECVTGTDRRPRKTAHDNRHLDGCRLVFPCGCVKRYYSTFLYKSGGCFRFYNPDKMLIETVNDGYCDAHFDEAMEARGYGKKARGGTA